jgi:hypothetical protein
VVEQARTCVTTRLAELDAQEDRYLDLLGDPDWLRDKIKSKQGSRPLLAVSRLLTANNMRSYSPHGQPATGSSGSNMPAAGTEIHDPG